jgi:hypothetical protein
MQLPSPLVDPNPILYPRYLCSISTITFIVYYCLMKTSLLRLSIHPPFVDISFIVFLPTRLTWLDYATQGL